MARIVVAIAVAVAVAVAVAALGPGGLGLSPWIVAGISSLVGAIVALAGNALVDSIEGKPKLPQSAQQEADDVRRLIRSATAPRRIIYGRSRVSGPLIYAASYGDQKEFIQLVIPLADHVCQSIDAIWLGETRIADFEIDSNGSVVNGIFANNVTIKRYIGNQTTADPDLVANSPDGWTAADKLTGITYIYLRMRFNADLFPYGIPNISAEVTGKATIQDPRTGSAGYTDNWALCILDYLRADYGLAVAPDEIDLPSFITAANLSDEAVPLNQDGSITQKRYTLNGTFTLDEAPVDIIEKMIAPGGGGLFYVAGRYRLFGGAYAAPVVTLTPSDLASGFEVITKPPRRDLFNTVRGTFIDPARFWQASEFPPVKSAALIAEDGEEIAREINMPFVLDATRAQRVSRQLLLTSRQSIVFRASFRYASLDLSVWQVVALTIPDLGWEAKPFRIVSFSFSPENGLITLSMQEEQVSSYAWTFDAAALVPDIADTTLVSPFGVPAPAGLSATESLYATRDGAGVRTAITLTWLEPENPFITGYEVQFKEAASTQYRNAPGAIAPPARIDDFASGVYDFRVRAVTASSQGAWANLRFSIGGLAAQPPVNVTGINLQAIGGLAWLTWDRHPDLDVRSGGRFEIRHTPSTSSPSWAGATSLGPAIDGKATFAPVPLRAGTYFIRAVDAGGVYGSVASIQSIQATALAFANVSTLTEDSGFTGTKTNTIASGGILKLDNLGDWDSIVDFDLVPDVDSLGLTAPEGSYNFSGGIDLTTVRPIRLSAHLLATVEEAGSNWDQRVAEIDDWLSVDGIFGGEADAWVEARRTNDDPAGSPTWSEWQRLDQAEFNARAFQFRAQLRAYQSEFNIEVTELRVAADEVA